MMQAFTAWQAGVRAAFHSKKSKKSEAILTTFTDKAESKKIQLFSSTTASKELNISKMGYLSKSPDSLISGNEHVLT